MQAIRSIDDINSIECEIARLRMSGLIFLYRGQSNASWPIQTSLFRKYGECWYSKDCWSEYINEYNSKKSEIVSKDILAYKPTIENDDFFILSTLRHLEFPCHLIDWSACLRMAILFACKENNDIDGSLWILSTNRRLNTSPITYSPFDIEKPALICKEFDLIPSDKSISDFPLGRIRRFRQNGYMSIIPRSCVCNNFESLLDNNYSLKKLIIPANSKGEIFEYLNGENSAYDYIMDNRTVTNTLSKI